MALRVDDTLLELDFDVLRRQHVKGIKRLLLLHIHEVEQYEVHDYYS